MNTLRTTLAVSFLLLLAPDRAPAQNPGAAGGDRARPDLPQVASRHLVLPNLGRTIHEVKRWDEARDEIVGSAIDDRGLPVDVSDLRRREVDARRADPRAKLQPDLLERCASHSGERLPAVAWLHFESEVLDAYARTVFATVDETELTTERVRQLEEVVARHVQERTAEVTRPFVAACARLGIPVELVSSTAPAVFVVATEAELLRLAELPETDTLYLDDTGGARDCNQDANDTHRTTRVHQQGVRGRGIRCATYSGIDPANPFLRVAAWYQPSGPFSAHATQVGGCIASRYAQRLGASPDVELYAANYSSGTNSEVVNADAWIVAQNVDVTNMSAAFGPNSTALQFLDRFFDHQVRYYQDSYVFAAGNEGNGTGNVMTPAKGWNVLTIGNHTDNGNGNWSDDTMAGSSSWVDPATGCEKPNLAANGSGILTLDTAANGYFSGSVTGTSFASPHAAGNLCNAMVVNTAIQTSPEAAMALMMATAWHNIEGSSTSSEYDGAGGLHGLAACRTALEGRVLWRTLTPASFSNIYVTETIDLVGGDRTRIAIAWSSSVNATYTTSTLDADLDIVIYRGANQTFGTSLASSFSIPDNFEVVEFTPPVSGPYTIRIQAYRFDGASERVGIAWSQKYRDTSSFQLRERTDVTAAWAGPTVGNPAYFMDFDAPNSPGATYLCLPSLTPPYLGNPGAAYSALNWQPLTHDALTDLWLIDVGDPGFSIWEGSIGALTASGASSANRIALIADPGLIGLTLYHVGFALGPGVPDTIREISEVHAFTILPQGRGRVRSNDGAFALGLPTGFRFYGTTYTQCWVNMNGNITFGGADPDATESIPEFLSGRPRIAFLWDDLDPSAVGSGGTPIVRVREMLSGLVSQQRVVIEFTNVPQNGVTDANTVRVTLRGGSDEILIEYLDVDLIDCLVGISPGSGTSAVTTEIDLGSHGQALSGAGNAMFEHFTGCVTLLNCDTLDLDSPNASHWNVVRFTPRPTQRTNYLLQLDLQ